MMVKEKRIFHHITSELLRKSTFFNNKTGMCSMILIRLTLEMES